MPFANRLTEILGVDVPIIQRPLGYIAKPELTAVPWQLRLPWAHGPAPWRRRGGRWWHGRPGR